MKKSIMYLIISLNVFFSCLEEQTNPLIDSVTVSCSDGIQNQDEEGVDCGGSCQPCPEPIVVPCAEELDGNIFFSDLAFSELNLTNTKCEVSISNGLFSFSGSSPNGDMRIRLGSESLPETEKEYALRGSVSRDDTDFASIELVFLVSGSFVSRSGELYLTYDGDNTAIVEFCEAIFANSFGTEITGSGRISCM